MTGDDLRERFLRDPPRSGLILDFDGTLAAIVEDPAAARMSDGAADPLRVLARHLGVVAVVSGRPAAFLGEHAAVEGVRLLGLYGTEEWRDGAAVPRPETQAWLPALDTARDRIASALAGHHGLVLEDKGLAVALHWRNAENRARAGAFAEQVAAGIAAETGLAQEPGKFVVELRPPIEWDKGSSVRMLVEEVGLETTAFLGDDRGDLAAFAAAREVGGVAVAVDHGEETPQELRDAADVVLAGPEAVVAWLARLASALEQGER